MLRLDRLGGLAALSLALSGCDFLGDVIEFGFWVAVILVVLIALGAWGMVRALKGRDGHGAPPGTPPADRPPPEPRTPPADRTSAEPPPPPRGAQPTGGQTPPPTADMPPESEPPPTDEAPPPPPEEREDRP